jgi:hypothetical protein
MICPPRSSILPSGQCKAAYSPAQSRLVFFPGSLKCAPVINTQCFQAHIGLPAVPETDCYTRKLKHSMTDNTCTQGLPCQYPHIPVRRGHRGETAPCGKLGKVLQGKFAYNDQEAIVNMLTHTGGEFMIAKAQAPFPGPSKLPQKTRYDGAYSDFKAEMYDALGRLRNCSDNSPAPFESTRRMNKGGILEACTLTSTYRRLLCTCTGLSLQVSPQIRRLRGS